MNSSLTARQHVTLAALSLGAVLVHGFHPLAEDGGIYVAGVKAVLDPALFPHDRVFVSSTEHYSMFAPLMAAAVRTLHMPLQVMLPLVYLVGVWLLLFAAWKLTQAVGASAAAQVGGVAILAAWMTLPVAGSSLLLMDPYVTARTLSTPLCLLAVACAITGGRRKLLECAACLLLAGILHPLMMAYGAALVVCVLVAKMDAPRMRLIWVGVLGGSALLVGAVLQRLGPVDTPAMEAAARSRYYWFLGEWQWYELLGLVGPLVVLRVVAWKRPTLRALSVGAMCLCGIAVVVALVFAREGAAVHAVGRLQPLRVYLLVYAVMAVLLGAALVERIGRWGTGGFVVAMAATMLFVQQQTFVASPHLEWPGWGKANAWSEAFVWAKENTPKDSLFAMDAKYITMDGEDGQVFRATAERSMLSDFSKDGGQAAIHPILADTWWQGQKIQQRLSGLDDAERMRRLAPLGVNWVVLKASAVTAWECPYKNNAVKVCSLTASK